jgi:hypothetical protein
VIAPWISIVSEKFLQERIGAIVAIVLIGRNPYIVHSDLTLEGRDDRLTDHECATVAPLVTVDQLFLVGGQKGKFVECPDRNPPER